MYIHLADWSPFKYLVEGIIQQYGLNYGGHFLKAFATEQDPRGLYRRGNITVFEVEDGPFRPDESFVFPLREMNFDGTALNEALACWRLDELTAAQVRALFRFAHQPETQFAVRMFSMQNTSAEWLFDHPLRIVDGIEKALRHTENMNPFVHLDIYLGESLDTLARLLGITCWEEAKEVVTLSEFKMRLRAEGREGIGMRRGKEG